MEVNTVSMVSNSTVAPKGNTKGIYMPNYRDALGADTVSFTAKKQKTDAEGNPKKSGFVHKALVSATGCFVPGMGQAINGQWGKALMFAVGVPVATIGALCVNPLLAIAIAGAGELGMFVDAYRNA